MVRFNDAIATASATGEIECPKCLQKNGDMDEQRLLVPTETSAATHESVYGYVNCVHCGAPFHLTRETKVTYRARRI